MKTRAVRFFSGIAVTVIPLLFVAHLSWDWRDALASDGYGYSSINDTGITTCSNATQNGLSCPVSGFPGQDAEHDTNRFYFTKLDANGMPLPVSATNHTCVLDNVTGLVWEVKTDDGGLRDKDHRYTWYDSRAPDANPGTPSGGYCYASGRCDTEKFIVDINKAGLCGFTDWRIPSPQELVGIINYHIAYPGPTIHVDYFPNTVGDAFWTNSTAAYSSDDSWYVYFAYGNVYSNRRANTFSVRAVRGGGSFLSLLQDNGDGTITDNSTGLMWAKCAIGQSGTDCSGSAISMTWQNALSATQHLTLAGYDDWHLPNAKELQSMVDYSRHSPSINRTYFPGLPNNYFWSSSPYADLSDSSWYVYFGHGSVGHHDRNYAFSARAVRRGRLSFYLGLTKLGGGSGTVLSTPAGINCGATCSASFLANSTVTLTATTNANNTFASWGGACSGTIKTCNVIMNEAKEVTAVFARNIDEFCHQCLPSMQGWRGALALISQLPNTRRARTMAIHKITPSTGVGGTIIPNTMRLVLTGTKARFTITPSTGKKATVTGTCGGTPTTGTAAFTYTTNPIRQNCTIQVSFAATLNKAALDTAVGTADTKVVADLPAWQDDYTVANSHTIAGIHAPTDLDTQALPILESSAFAFTKLDANGQELPAEALDYTCLRDNATGLIWESKTQDGGLQDQNWSYTWYDANKPGDQAGTASGGTCYTVGRCDSEKYTHDINARALCGGQDWRLPTIAELATIANSQLTQYQPPTWAAFDPSLVDGYNAMVVNFVTGHIDSQPRSVGNAIMLVQ